MTSAPVNSYRGALQIPMDLDTVDIEKQSKSWISQLLVGLERSFCLPAALLYLLQLACARRRAPTAKRLVAELPIRSPLPSAILTGHRRGGRAFGLAPCMQAKSLALPLQKLMKSRTKNRKGMTAEAEVQ